jgi:hypothetical protein
MRIFTLIAALGLISLNGLGQPFRLPDPPPSPSTPQQAYEQLLTVQNFTFGGSYASGYGSQGERACVLIAESTNAIALFSATVTNGNAQAKMYALCGIRQVAPKMFDAYANPLRLANPVVDTTFGDQIRHTAATNIIDKISKGSYDIYFKKQKP